MWQVQTAMQSGAIEAAVDSAVRGEYNVESVWKLADLARRCVAMSSVDRPTMATVLQEVNVAIDIENGIGCYVPYTSPGRPSVSAPLSTTDTSNSSSAFLSEVVVAGR